LVTGPAAAFRITVVTPLRNAKQYLPTTVPTVLEAARTTGSVELIYVDNGSTDGSFEYLAAFPGIRVFQRENESIAAVRNYGARLARGEYLSFLDADCAISPNYFDEALEAIRISAAAATGFEVQLPADPHWIEATWHDLHAGGSDREVEWINSANFFISRETFERIGGFREDLLTGEDTEIGQRLIRHGGRLWAARRLAITHLGNPKTLRAFHRQKLWHGLGMFGTIRRGSFDKPTVMMIVHALATFAGAVTLFAGRGSFFPRALIALGLQLLAPATTVAYRVSRAGRPVNLPKAVFLYWIYYWARLEAFILVLTGRERRFVK
jgi:glycosyltransferase involved in cell wall biosynthesis